MKELEKKVMEALGNVYDLEIGVDIVSLGLIYGVEVSDSGDVKVKMTLTTPMCPLAGFMTQDAQSKVSTVEGVNSVDVELTFDPPWSPDKASDDIRKLLGI